MATVSTSASRGQAGISPCLLCLSFNYNKRRTMASSFFVWFASRDHPAPNSGGRWRCRVTWNAAFTREGTGRKKTQKKMSGSMRSPKEQISFIKPCSHFGLEMRRHADALRRGAWGGGLTLITGRHLFNLLLKPPPQKKDLCLPNTHNQVGDLTSQLQ